jgi:hypothetical protein
MKTKYKRGDRLICVLACGGLFVVGKVYVVSEDLQLKTEGAYSIGINDEYFISATPLLEALT